MVYAIHWHESATGTLMSPNPEPPSHLLSPHPEPASYLPPNPIPLDCPRAPALSALLHSLSLHWSSILAMVFPVVMFGCENWTIKNAELWRINAFELCYWRRLFRVPWTARRSNQSILKEISPEYSLEELVSRPTSSKAGFLWTGAHSTQDWFTLRAGFRIKWDNMGKIHIPGLFGILGNIKYDHSDISKRLWAIPNPERWFCESATLNMPANLENSAVATGLEKVSFHSNPKERQCQRMLKLPHIALISHASKVMLKILQARLQQYVNPELPDVQAGFRNQTVRCSNFILKKITEQNLITVTHFFGSFFPHISHILSIIEFIYLIHDRLLSATYYILL